MPSGKDFMRDLIDSAARGAYRPIDDAYADGFNEAAHICVSALSESINELLAQIKSGSYLSNEEQFLLSRLSQLKTEMEFGLRNFWASESVDRDPA
ncbi:hypothetical protein GCM10027073_52690 [Streptomyces chlorus]|uniref:Uncharacterized protein n=1 Tax=Streptomyces chlorus TaxID=887452 RepID=A0ABW1DVX3_9ACTN